MILDLRHERNVAERAKQAASRQDVLLHIDFFLLIVSMVAVVGAFVSSQIEPARRCRAPRASVGSQIEPACALLGAQVARAGRNGLASSHQTRSIGCRSRAAEAFWPSGAPNRAPRRPIGPARASQVAQLVAQLSARIRWSTGLVEQFRY